MEELDPEEQFLRYARNGDLSGVQRLLLSKIKGEAQLNINCKGLGRFLEMGIVDGMLCASLIHYVLLFQEKVNLTWDGHLFTWPVILDTKM